MRNEKKDLIDELILKILTEAQNMKEDEKRYLQDELFEAKRKIWKGITPDI